MKPSTTGQSAGTIEEQKQEPLKRKDLLVIAALWSLEIAYVLAESWKSSFLVEGPHDHIYKERVEKKNFFLSNQILRSLLLVLTLLTIVAMAILADGRQKFTYLLAGLGVYFVTPIIGLLATNLSVVGMIDFMFLLEFGWTSVSALRYWLIFHQKFPISVVHSRWIVSCNELFVGFTEFTTAAWVSLNAFAPSVYNAVWVIILVLMAIWMGAVWAVKSYMNNVEDKNEVIQKIYGDVGMMESFNGRETFRHLVTFSCLIFPTLMISMQKASVSFIFKLIKEDLPEFAKYRFDLLLGLVCLAVLSGILIKFVPVRHEIRDLIVIGAAHTLNVLVWLAFLLLIMRSPEASANDTTEAKKEPLHFPFDTVFTYFLHPDYPEMTFKDHGAEHGYVGYSTSVVSLIPARNGHSSWVTGYYKNKTQAFDKKFVSTSNKGYYINSNNLTKVKNFGGLIKPGTESTPSLIFVSGLTPCTTGPRNDTNGTRCMYNNGCHSVKISLTIDEMETKKPVLGEQKVNIPFLGETLAKEELKVASNQSMEYRIYYLVDGQRQAGRHLYSHVHQSKYTPFTVIFTTISRDSDGIFLNRAVDHLWRYVLDERAHEYPASRLLTFSALCASSMAIAVASASYKHFAWIQCPSNHRVLILAGFFGANFLGASLSGFLLTGLVKSQCLTLLFFQLFGGVCHLFSTIVFYRNLRQLTPQEETDIKKMQFYASDSFKTQLALRLSNKPM